jgi:hypothetical protein
MGTGTGLASCGLPVAAAHSLLMVRAAVCAIGEGEEEMEEREEKKRKEKKRKEKEGKEKKEKEKIWKFFQT